MKTIPVATRLTPHQLAKARDGLIKRGIAPEQLVTKSQILRLAILLAITMNENPETPASDESLAIISQ